VFADRRRLLDSRHWRCLVEVLAFVRRDRFVAALPAVTALGFDEPFVRTWLMYLAFSEAAFAERTLGDHQLLLTLAG
jgi:cyclopropane fatty-acyl-phospholipid synthase-like methyltransferase